MQSLLSLVFLGSVIAIIYSWRKAKSVKNENPDNFENNEDYQKFSNIKKKAIIVCVVFFLLGNFFDSSTEDLGVNPEDFANNFNKAPIGNLKILRVEKGSEKGSETFFIA